MENPINSLAVTHPHLAAEYSEKNELPATQVTAGTHKKFWWRCRSCGCEWQASGSHRLRGHGCPADVNRVVTATNNLTAVHPHLAAEYSERNELPANQVIAGTGKKLWWKCAKCGHAWLSSIQQRVKHTGCPNCAKEKAA